MSVLATTCLYKLPCIVKEVSTSSSTSQGESIRYQPPRHSIPNNSGALPSCHSAPSINTSLSSHRRSPQCRHQVTSALVSPLDNTDTMPTSVPGSNKVKPHAESAESP